MRTRFSAALAVAALAFAPSTLHCSSPSSDDVGENEAAHTAKRPVHDNAAYFWAATDYDTFRRVAQAAPFRTGQPLEATGLVASRLQAWADRIHAEVVKDVRRQTGTDLVAPRPILVVVPAKDANAWVSGIPACFTAEADLSAIGKPDRPARVAGLAFAQHDGIKEAFSLFGAPPPKCVSPSNWGSTADAIAFFNASGSRCHLERTDGDKVKVTGDGCAMLSGDTGPTVAKQLTFYATSPYVHFTTAMLALAQDERAIVGIVAHELAHYYRAHAVSDLVMGRYNHWYEQEDRPEKTTPTATADSEQIEAHFRRAMPYPTPRVAGQRVSHRLTDLVVDPLARLLETAAAASPTFACKSAVAKLGDWRYDFAGFGVSFVSKATADAYLAYEDTLLSCAGAVSVTPGGGAGALALADVRKAIDVSATPFASPPVETGTLADVLRAVGDRAAVVDRDADDLLAALRARRLGKYTAEQEADDFSLEYFARAGLTARARIETYFDLIRLRAAESPERFVAANGGLDVAACEALYRSDFRERGPDGRQQIVFVPLGNLHDPHHGDCYRLFNMSQELRAHRFRATGAAPTFEAPWEAVRAAAEQATEDFRLGGGGGPGGPSALPQRSGGPGGGVIVDGF